MSRAFSCLFHQLLLAVLDVEAFGGNVCEAMTLEVVDGISKKRGTRNEERGTR